jgi:hypothetical protein
LLRRIAKGVALLAAAVLAVVAYNGLSFQQRVNNRPLPAGWLKGVFHLHSSFSDGRGGVDEICQAAAGQGLDFVLLSDHGRPNRAASAASAWRRDVLLIGGSEFSLHAGHLAAAGYQVPAYRFPPEAQEAIDEVRRDGGVTFVSHPYDGRIPWTDETARGFTGIEIVSLYQMAKRNMAYALTLFPLQYLLSPDYALTAVISFPGRELALWDRLCREGRYYGIYALDAHAKIELGEKAQLGFPSYAAMFRILRVYVHAGGEPAADAGQASAAVIAALRRGDFFSAIESLAAANGFEFFYREPDGRRVEMGGAAERAGGALVMRLPFPFAVDVRVLRDGAPFRSFTDSTRPEIEVAVDGPGAYRCEVYLHSGRLRRLPWILANPVFVARRERAVPAVTPPPARALLDDGTPRFQVEKNGRSQGAAAVMAGADGRSVTRLDFVLRRETPSSPDFWVALARRGRLDLSPYRGVVLEARASRPLRAWLQLRAAGPGAGSAFQHSFRADGQWRRLAIPLARCHRLYGTGTAEGRAGIDALFVLVDGGIAEDGAAGALEIRQLGFY